MGQWVIGHGSNGSTNVNGSRGSQVSTTGAVLGRQNTFPNNLPPNMAAYDLRCSEMPHYCRV